MMIPNKTLHIKYGHCKLFQNFSILNSKSASTCTFYVIFFPYRHGISDGWQVGLLVTDVFVSQWILFEIFCVCWRSILMQLQSERVQSFKASLEVHAVQVLVLVNTPCGYFESWETLSTFLQASTHLELDDPYPILFI